MVCRSCGHTWVNRKEQAYPVLTRFIVIALLALLFFLYRSNRAGSWQVQA